MTEELGTPAGRKRRPKRQLTPTQKYEIWLQLVRQEATMAEAAATAGVDRSTILRIRQVAKDGALTALAASKPGAAGQARDAELAAANAEIRSSVTSNAVSFRSRAHNIITISFASAGDRRA